MSHSMPGTLRLVCEWSDGDTSEGAHGGYSLGHMSFIGRDGECSSRSPTKLPMMLNLSLIELLDSVRAFLEAGASAPGFTFRGTASSFAVEFARAKGKSISVRCSGRAVAHVDAATLGSAILVGAEEFMRGPGSALSASDAVRPDLGRALTQLTACLEALPES